MSAALPKLLDRKQIATELRVYDPCVYVMENDYGVKIGITICVGVRVGEISRASGTNVTLVRHWPMDRSRSKVIEAWAHHELREWRTVGEWFHVHPIEACDTVERLIRRAPRGGPVPGLTQEAIDAFLAQRVA